MTSAVQPLLRFLAILAVVAIGGTWLLQGVDQSAAQAVGKPKPVDGRKTVISGIKSYEAGRMDTAVATLTKAISGGGLSSQDLAKALYYRGLAHQRSKQSAQAIADLTSAVWMKGGLSPSEQQTALAARSKAYAAVGVSDPGPPAQSIGKPSPAAPPSRAAPVPAQTNQVAAAVKSTPQAATPPSSGFQTQVTRSSKSPTVASTEPAAPASNPLSGVGNFFSNIFSGGSTASSPQPTATAPATPPVAAAPVVSTNVAASQPVSAPAQPAPHMASVETPAVVVAPAPPAPVKPKKPVVSAPPVHAPFQTTLLRAPSPPPAAPPRSAPPRAAPPPRVTTPTPAAPPNVAPATSTTLTAAPSAQPSSRFQPLSNKGVRLSSLQELSNDTVGNLFSNVFGGSGSSPPASNQAPAGGSNTAVSAWSSEKPGTGAGSAAQPQGVPATTASIGSTRGGYNVQVADVRSLGEAERLAYHLRQRHAAKFGGRVPRVSEKVYGNMGRFYQVSVGPFAKTSETARICALLKADGFDCRAVKN